MEAHLQHRSVAAPSGGRAAFGDNVLDYAPETFKISIHARNDLSLHERLKQLINKEQSGDHTWYVDLRDYRQVLQAFAGYNVSSALHNAISKIEAMGGVAIIPDVVLAEKDGRIKVALPVYNSDIISLLQVIPHRVFQQEDCCWYVPMSQLRTVVEALQRYKIYALRGIRDEVKPLLAELVEREQRRERNRNLLAATSVELDYDFKVLPFFHQRVGIKFLSETTHAGLFDEQGLGKSEQVICALDLWHKRGSLEHAVIVCPNSVKYTWADEVAKHSSKGVSIIAGSKAQRADLFKHPSFFIVINYELLRNEEEAILALLEQKRCALVFDESQKIKNRNAKTTKTAHQLSAKAAHCYITTGTPIGNRPEDLWSQVFILDQGRLFGNYFDFLREYCVLGNQYSSWAIQRYRNLAGLKEKLQSISIRRLKKDVLDLPEKLYQRFHVELSGDQAALYQAMQRECFVMVRDMSDREFEQRAQNVLVQMLRLSQLAANPRLIDPSASKDNAKFVELDALLNDLLYEDQKVVIWSSYIQSIKELQERYVAYGPQVIYGDVKGEERHHVVETFQSDPKMRLLIANPKTAREGLTLTRANTAIYVDRTFNAVDYWQSQDRIHRIGQAGSCTIINFIAKNTIDEYIDSVLEQKREYSLTALGDEGNQDWGVEVKLDRKTALSLLTNS